MIIAISIYSILNFACLIHIILYGSRPTKSLSWLLIILILPFIGIILYIIFGLNRRRLKLFTLKQTLQRKFYNKNYKDQKETVPVAAFENNNQQKLARILYNSSGFQAIAGNKTTVLQKGTDTFDTIFEVLAEAEHFIHVQYYLIEDGKICERFFSLFQEKIAQGVEVRLLYDAIGSYALKRSTLKSFAAIGVHIFPIMPFEFGSFLFTLNYRNHRKIIVVDGIKGFTGGVNISDKYIKSTSELGIWDDTHLYLEGPVMDHLHRVFIKDYYFASDKELLLNDHYLPDIEKKGNVSVQIVSGGPDADHPTIMQQYIGMITMAENYIAISNPYFIPNSAMLEALRMAALSGVKIQLLVPKKSDSWLAKYSVLSYFEELLFLGVEIFQQKNDFLHSKVIIVDDQIASVGSGNFDHRSFEHNFETNALLYDKEMAAQIKKDFIEDCNQSELLDYESYKNRPIRRKLAEGIARFFSPLL